MKAELNKKKLVKGTDAVVPLTCKATGDYITGKMIDNQFYQIKSNGSYFKTPIEPKQGQVYEDIKTNKKYVWEDNSYVEFRDSKDGKDGKSAYQSYVDTTTDNPPKTEAEWVASLKGEDGVSLGEVAIADNTTTDDARKVLSARQGYLLGQKVNDVDDVPTAGSEKFVKSGGVQNELALGAVYDVSAKNPTAGINNDGKWESLSTLLSDANLNNLIPTSVRKGGMSIKFVQSSDNKYTRYNLLADSFTTDITQWAIDDSGVYVDNPEFIYVKTDAEGKILWAIKTDGGIYYGAGVPQQVKDYIEEKIADLSLDEYEDIVAFLNDYLGGDATLKSIIDSLANTKVDKEEGKSLIDAEYASSQSTIENPELIEAKTDTEDKLLAGRTPDGAAFENVGFSTPKISIDGHIVENIEDLEGRTEIKTDSEGKIISYRDSDGVVHENVGIAFNERAMSDFYKMLKINGYAGTNDWSDAEFVELPMPEVCAVINLGVGAQAIAKGLNIPTTLEYWDKYGNYFKKPILLNAQGSSSIYYWIKNQAFDLDDGSEIKIGNWVAQDSFHIKKYYIDAFRGQCIVAYWLTEQMYQTRPFNQIRPWSYLIQTNSASNGLGKFNKDFDTGALAHPDGFPVHLYFDGRDAGVYTFNLKKHRDNYYANKSNAKNIILDGQFENGELFGGNVDWTAFEIRNPKGLKDINGKKYDGDNPTELSDTDPFSAEVKGYIQDLADACGIINANKTKEEFEKHFIVPFFIDYFLISQVLYHFDGFWKNWIWCTWDGKRWTPTSYDMDSIFGADTNGTQVIPAGQYVPIGDYSVRLRDNCNQILGFSTAPINLLWELYETEIKARYKELRDNGVFSTNNIVKLLSEWVKKCGYKNLKNDIENVCAYNGVPQTPSYRDGSNTYALDPKTGGFYNSIQRVGNWLNEHFEFLDSAGIFNYSQN